MIKWYEKLASRFLGWVYVSIECIESRSMKTKKKSAQCFHATVGKLLSFWNILSVR